MIRPTEKELKEFEKAKEKCPFCGEEFSAQYRGDDENSLYFGCCDRVLVCNDIGLFGEGESIEE